MNDQEEIDTTYHEAGHAVMGCIVGRIPLSVTIVPDGKGAVGETRFETNTVTPRHYDASPVKRQFAEQRVLTEVAGTIAHDIKTPGRAHDLGDETDARWARELVIELVSWEDDREAYLRRMEQKAKDLLNQHWSWVEAVARALHKRKTLSREEILALRPT